MNRRARLNLISVGLVALLTGVISVYYLKIDIEKHFQFSLERADAMKRLAADSVARSSEQQSNLPIPEALAIDIDLAARLLKIMSVSGSLIEIAVCDRHNKVLLCTDRRPGDIFPSDYPDYEQLAKRSSLLQKIRVLLDVRTPKYYQLSEALGPEGQNADLWVRVVILPVLLRKEIVPELERAGVISLLSILGSILIAFVFSHFAFKPLSNVTRMLDHLTRGEYVSETPELPGGSK